MSKIRRQYSAEYRSEAVRLITEEGYSVSDAARSLGINASMLSRWKHEIVNGGTSSSSSGFTDSEVQSLRKEVRQLRMERDILKKAVAFFANNPH